MISGLRAWGKDQDMQIKWGSFYTVVRNLDKHGLIAAVENVREGRRPERAARHPGRVRGRVPHATATVRLATGLDDDDLNVYLRPYPTPESRRPLLQWPWSMPLGGEPADVVARVEQYDAWLATSDDVPKLLLTFEPGPGAMLGPEMVDWYAANIARLEIEQLGLAGHHAPEDQPKAIAAALRDWAKRHTLL